MICAKERSTEVNEAPHNSPGVILWCSISQAKIIERFFFDEGSVTGAPYRNMLIQYVFPRFSELREDYVFMQYGASPHYSISVRNYLDQKRPNNWIRIGGPIKCPARSLDLTTCEFFI